MNYFEYLHLNKVSTKQGVSIIHKFIDNLPSLKNAQEPYPTSLRIINWTKFLVLREIKDKRIDEALFRQTLQLSERLEYHILGNHLLENGFALFFAAYYFQYAPFYELAKQILVPELEEQILADGGHFERSPMYHQLMLFRVLDCINLATENPSFDDKLNQVLLDKAAMMLGWLEQMTFKGGQIPHFNDSTSNINPTSQELFDYANRLEIPEYPIALGESGYRRVEAGDMELIADVGKIGPDYLPGHSHNDILSFVLYKAGKPFLVDTGTSTYEIGERRQTERSTEAHNTVQVDGKEQSETWAGFRVARRSYPNVLKDESEHLEAELVHFSKQYRHKRTFRVKEKAILINDVVKGSKSKAFLHFHPDVDVLAFENGVITTSFGSIQLRGGVNHVETTTYQYAYTFNEYRVGMKCIIQFSGTLQVVII
ncbi:MAG: heparinase II/III family protein [Bacteroidota bacterium]